MTAYTAARLEAPGKFTITHLPALAVPEGWVTVQVSYTGVCGSDFPIVDGTHLRACLPLVMGHEITGVVQYPGGGLLPTGTRVAVNPLLSCGNCGPCRSGLTHVCRNLRLLGIDAPGSLATHMAAPADNLVPFRSGVDPVQAALAEPLAVAVHAVRRSRLRAGEDAVVFGAGPIGLLVALVARHAGSPSVTVIEPSPGRRKAAEALGFAALEPDRLPDARQRGDGGPVVVFDCAGHPSVAAQITRSAPVHGRIIIVAIYHAAAAFDLRELAFAEQEVIGARVYAREDFVAAVRLIEEGALDLHRLPVSVLPLEEVSVAIAQARSAGAAVKTLIQSGH